MNPESRTMNFDTLTKDQRIKRTRKVARAIIDYSPGEDAREAFIDLLTDALHLFGEEQVRFHLDWALQHYHAENGEVLAS
jgi:hypothetical protein